MRSWRTQESDVVGDINGVHLQSFKYLSELCLSETQIFYTQGLAKKGRTSQLDYIRVQEDAKVRHSGSNKILQHMGSLPCVCNDQGSDRGSTNDQEPSRMGRVETVE